MAPVMVAPPPPPPVKKDVEMKKEDGEKKETEKKETKLSAPATIVVSLPAAATLTIDDAATRSTSATRVFATPTLEAGKAFSYTLKAEIVRDGQKVTTTKVVEVRAGQETRVAIDFPVASVASR